MAYSLFGGKDAIYLGFWQERRKASKNKLRFWLSGTLDCDELKPRSHFMKNILMEDLGDAFFPIDPEPNKLYRHINKHQTRFIPLQKAEVTEERTIELSVSSSTPYLRWFGYEELEHSSDSIDLSRFNDGANVLFNHNRDDYIGVIKNAWIEGEKLYNRISFDTHALAEKIYQSIKSGIIRNVSIGYEIKELVLIESADDYDRYRVKKWTPFETSIVTVPADQSVGVGRSYFVSTSRENWGEETAPLPRSSKEDQEIKEATRMPEIEINETDLIKTERERVQGIYALAQKYGNPELAKHSIGAGLSIEAARSKYLDEVTVQKQEPVATGVKPLGMSDPERRSYSFNRAVGYAAGLIPADKCGLELEVSRALEQRIGKPPQGKLYLDQSQLVSYPNGFDSSYNGGNLRNGLSHRAPYETGVPVAAGNLISTDLLSDRFIEQLYNMSAFLPMGVTYLRDLQGNIEIPREATYQNAYWIGEGQTITEDEGTFDKITLSPKKIAVISKMTYEMTVQSSIDLEQLTRNRIMRAIALEIDRTIGFGSGTGEEPLGIISHPEVNSIVLGANGGELDWAAVIAMQSELAVTNAMNQGTFGYVVNARTRGKLQTKLNQDTGAGTWIWQMGNNSAEGMIAGYRARCSNQIPNNLVKGTASNLSAAFFGDFSNVLLGIWSGLDLMANPYSQFDQAIISIRAMQMLDLNLTRGEYFVVATDIINT